MSTIRGRLNAIIAIIAASAAALCLLVLYGSIQSFRSVEFIEENLAAVNDLVSLRSHINKHVCNFLDCLIQPDDVRLGRFEEMDAMLGSQMESFKRDHGVGPGAMEDYQRLSALMRTALAHRNAGRLAQAVGIAEHEVEGLTQTRVDYSIAREIERHMAAVEAEYSIMIQGLPLLPWQRGLARQYRMSVGHALDYFRAINSTEALLHRQMKELRDYVLSGHTVERHEFFEMVEEVEASFNVWRDVVAAQRELGVEGEDKDLESVAGMSEAYGTAMRIVGDIVGYMDMGREQKAASTIIDELDPFMSSNIFEGIEKAIDDGRGEISDARELLRKLAIRSTVQPMAVALIISIALIAGLRRLMAGMLRSLESLRVATEEIGSGRLGYRMEPMGGDELGQLGEFVNRMAQNLSEMTISRDYLENIFTSMYDSVVVLDRQGTIKYTNQAACRMLGYEYGGLEGKGIRLICPGIWEGWKQYSSIEGSEPVAGLELDFIASDGSVVNVLCSMSAMDEKAQAGHEILITAMDMSERKEIAQRLENAKLEWERTLDAIEDPIMLLDRDLRVVRANRALAEAVGVDIKDTVGLHCSEAMSFCDCGSGNCPNLRLLEDGRTHTSEVRDGRSGRIYSVSVSPYYDINGELVGSVHQTRDITDRKKMEDDIIRHREQLSELVRERTEDLREANQKLAREMDERRRLEGEVLGREDHERRMIGNDLHDGLGQLLTGVSFKAMSLERKLRRLAMSEADEAENIKELIDQAKVDVKRLSGGLTSLALGEGGLRAALEELARSMQRTFGIPIELSYGDEVETGDSPSAYHLFRIAQEAATNAIKYSGAGSISLNLFRSSGKIILEVSDDGRGMPEDADGSGGLGLRIMRHRADIIGASLEVRSDNGTGTTVSCILPAPNQGGQDG